MEAKSVFNRLRNHAGAERDDVVAELLGLSKQSYGGFKARGKIRFEALAEYCQHNGISIDSILFGHDPGEKINEQLKIENERLKAKLEIVLELLNKAIGKDK